MYLAQQLFFYSHANCWLTRFQFMLDYEINTHILNWKIMREIIFLFYSYAVIWFYCGSMWHSDPFLIRSSANDLKQVVIYLINKIC